MEKTYGNFSGEILTSSSGLDHRVVITCSSVDGN